MKASKASNTQIKNKVGPRIEPWGAHEVILNKLKVTFWCYRPGETNKSQNIKLSKLDKIK